jgi:hypothetical protein
MKANPLYISNKVVTAVITALLGGGGDWDKVEIPVIANWTEKQIFLFHFLSFFCR